MSEDVALLLQQLGRKDWLSFSEEYHNMCYFVCINRKRQRFTSMKEFVSGATKWVTLEVAVYSFDGILVFGLLFICTCAYLKKVPRLKNWLLSEKKGVWGVFYKAAVIGTRLHLGVALSCFAMAFYVLFIK